MLALLSPPLRRPLSFSGGNGPAHRDHWTSGMRHKTQLWCSWTWSWLPRWSASADADLVAEQKTARPIFWNVNPTFYLLAHPDFAPYQPDPGQWAWVRSLTLTVTLILTNQLTFNLTHTLHLPIYIYPYAHRLKRRVVNKLDLGKVNPIKSN